MIRRPPLLHSLLLLLPLAACAQEAKTDAAAKPEATTVTEHRCTVQIAAAGEPTRVEGEASGEDEAAALEAAYADACTRLPEDARADCKDEGKFEVMIAGGSATADGKTNYSKTVTLKAKVATVEGRGASTKSKDEACAAAVAEACKAAGATGDCVAAGTHQKRGESSSTATQRTAPAGS